jgi:hypothetical protein
MGGVYLLPPVFRMPAGMAVNMIGFEGSYSNVNGSVMKSDLFNDPGHFFRARSLLLLRDFSQGDMTRPVEVFKSSLKYGRPI